MARKNNTKISADANNTQRKLKRCNVSLLTRQEGIANPPAKDRSTFKRRPEKKQKSKNALKEEAEELRLTALLFGGDKDAIDVEEGGRESERGGTGEVSQFESADEHSSLMFKIDRIGADEEEGENLLPSTTKNNGKECNADDVNTDSNGDANDDEEDGQAWVDDDDDLVQIGSLGTDRLKKLRKSRSDDQTIGLTEFQRRLRNRYITTIQHSAHAEWAQLDDDDGEGRYENDESEDDAAAALQSSSHSLLIKGASSFSQLPPSILNVLRCPDANQADYNNAVVQAVNFHPGSDPEKPLLLTAGLDKTLRFFQVSAEKSEKIHGIHFPKLPIYSAHFLGESGKVVVSGRRPFFYVYDSIAGKLDHIPRILGREEKSWERCFPSPDGKMIAFVGNDGYVVLVDVKSKQWMASLKLNGSVRAVAFTPDGEYILASGSDGNVYRWEIRSRRCVERFTNQGGTITSYLATSRRRHLAVGSESGVVNLYKDKVVARQPQDLSLNMEARTPIKSIMNLHTSADVVKFNYDGQIMAMSSRREKQSLKLLHVPTATVFSNWPTSKTPLGYVTSLDFSPQSKFLAVGNDKGKCILYQLQHYNQGV